MEVAMSIRFSTFGIMGVSSDRELVVIVNERGGYWVLCMRDGCV